MVHNDKNRVNRNRQLLRLHEMRVDICEFRYREEQRQYREAKNALDQRLAAIEDLRTQRAAVRDYMATEAVIAAPRLMEMANTRRYWLEYDLEKDEFYLDMDREAVQEAEQRCAKARAQWLHARAREDGARSLLKASQNALARRDEQRQELENEETFSGKVKYL